MPYTAFWLMIQSELGLLGASRGSRHWTQVFTAAAVQDTSARAKLVASAIEERERWLLCLSQPVFL